MVLTAEQEKEIKGVFKKFASGGSIGSSEIGKASRAAGLNPTEADLDLWKGEAKKGLDLDGFTKFMSKQFEDATDSVEEIIESFQSFDATGSGLITVGELKAILTTMGEQLSQPEFQMLLGECDVEDGKIAYMEVAHMLFGTE